MKLGLTVLHGLFFLVVGSALIVSEGIAPAAAERGEIAASAREVQPLPVGARAPRFTVRTVDDAPFVFDPDDLDAPTVLIAFRGGWCPYCNMHLAELRHAVPSLRDRGIDVIFLSGDRPALLYAGLKRETRETIAGLGYTILSDSAMDAATALGIAYRAADETIAGYEKDGRDIAGSSMKLQHALPVPAVFVIDRDGTIAYTFVEPDYKVRLAANDLLAAVESVVP